MHVVVVESPAKAKSIGKYLGRDYRVLATYGHVRDLMSKDGSVRPDDDFAMVYETEARSEKQIREILRALDGAETLYLATDPDREGEAISWHVYDLLRERAALGRVAVKRVTFQEITKGGIAEAMRHPRDLDMDLINAQQARRALDYLVGFTLSPVLWRKLPGSRSAGRVQSVALRLICDREAEIEAFEAREYWTIEGTFTTAKNERIVARLSHLDGRKLDKFDLGDADAAQAVIARGRDQDYAIAAVEQKQVRRNPAPPFITSTLQQEASRKLGFAARRTMSVAQRLYEGVDIGGETVGLITYMRTDGVYVAAEAQQGCRAAIERTYGRDYLPASPRQYASRAKSAQEAHEAIRPTDFSLTPARLKAHLESDQLRLYELIWQRMIASQMASAILDQVAIDIDSADAALRLRATGSVVRFDGFLRVYQEGTDDSTDEAEARLPAVSEGERTACEGLEPKQHFTEPLPRYSEASLVKKLEELGIGRPSTYASIISVLQDRGYVRIDKRRFIPEDRGRLVTAFLVSFFRRYVEYDFTAALEDQLDDIASGRNDWKAVLRAFWSAFAQAVDETKDLRVKEVLDALDDLLGPHFFPTGEDGREARACPACSAGRLGLKLGRYGPFLGCSNYPECSYTRRLAQGDAAQDGGELTGPRLLGQHPETGEDITVRAGPYGPYIQRGEAPMAASDKAKAKTKAKTKTKAASAKSAKAKDAKAKTDKAAPTRPPRVSLPEGIAAADITLETALALLALPRTLGAHPETGHSITAGIGRFGPYVKHGPTYARLAKDDDVLSVGLNRAVSLLADTKPRRGAEPLRSLGEHPEDGQPVVILNGRYGPYVHHGRTNASLPAGTEVEEITLERALELLAQRAQRGGRKSGAAKGGSAKAGRGGAKNKRTNPVTA